MKRYSMRKLALLFGFALLASAPRATHAQDVGPALGTVIKPVTLADLDGKPVNLAQYIGKKPVLFEFWATWCPICAELEPRLSAAAKKYAGKVDVVVVAVGVNENPRSIKRHLAKHAAPGPVLFDGDGAATRAFEAPSTSYVIVLDRKGRVVYTGTGVNQNIDLAMSKATR
jgi:thioredoxin-like negative regulator of GroEL